MGYIARAPTEHVKATDAGLERSIFIEREDKVKSPTRVVGLGRLRILLIEAKQAEYRPITQDRWVANACALRNVGNLMAAELVPDTVHNGYKANRARIGDLARYVDQAINQDRNDRPGAPPRDIVRASGRSRVDVVLLIRLAMIPSLLVPLAHWHGLSVAQGSTCGIDLPVDSPVVVALRQGRHKRGRQ